MGRKWGDRGLGFQDEEDKVSGGGLGQWADRQAVLPGWPGGFILFCFLVFFSFYFFPSCFILVTLYF